MLMRIAVCSAIAVTLLASAAVPAQDKFPSRPITMIVAFPPGGVADKNARPTSAALEKVLGQPVTITNQPGAGGAVGKIGRAHV